MNIKRPRFSIVIPTYNRPERLERCLQSIAQLDFPKNYFEVVVVDDGSLTDIETITKPFQSILSLQLIRQSNAGPASARNTGANQAKGDYLVFTDDDCQPYPDWLTALEEATTRYPNALIGGRTINALESNVFSTASQLLIDYLYQYYNQISVEATFFASNNFAMPRKIFQEIGGFNTNFPLAAGEDREFCDRWKRSGFPLHYAPSMRIKHAHDLSLFSFWRQHFNYGRGAFVFHLIRCQRNNQKIKVEPFSFYTELILYPFRKLPVLLSFQVSCLLLLSQIGNFIGFFWQKASQHRVLGFFLGNQIIN